MKKGIFLLAVMVLLATGWSGVWYYVSGKVETVIAETKTKLADRGREFECSNQEINGYPFRISLNCDTVRYSDDVTGLRVKTGKMRTAAQAYQPNKAVAELSCPASLQLPSGDSFETTWQSMRSSVRAGLSGPENLSLHGQQVVLVPTGRQNHALSISDMQFHGRQVGENSINLAINLKEAQSQTNAWPTFDLASTFLLQDTYSDIVNRTSLLRVARSKGLKGNIQRFRYAPAEGGVLEIKGPAEVSPQGLLSGKFDVTVRDLPKLIDALSKSFPQERQKFSDASRAISLLSNKTGNRDLTLPVTIRNGSVSIGIIPLGKINPLF